MQFSRGGSLVSAAGAVVITANDYKEVPSTWLVLTSAFVVKLHTGSGTQFKNNLPVTTDSCGRSVAVRLSASITRVYRSTE
jgi:hypothetical protein